MDLRVGGKYRIGKKIGSGSFGEQRAIPRGLPYLRRADRLVQATSTSV